MTRTCPNCAERIQDAATLCRFCGRSVDPVSTRPSSGRTLLLSLLLLVLLVALGIAGLYSSRSQSPAARTIGVGEALQHAQAGRVASAEMEGDRARLQLRDGSQVETSLPSGDRTLEQLVISNGGSVSVREPGGLPIASLGLAVLAALLPMLLIGLFLYLVIRLAVRHALRG